jgi:hypothetical protein
MARIAKKKFGIKKFQKIESHVDGKLFKVGKFLFPSVVSKVIPQGIYLFKFIALMQPLGYERPTPHLILTDNTHPDTQAEPRKLSSLTLYIDLWQEGKPAPGQNPPMISPPVGIFRRIGVRAEIRTQNPVLSNTRLVKMAPLSHLRRPTIPQGSTPRSCILIL